MPLILWAVCTFAFKSLAAEHPQGTAKIETRFFRFTLSGETGQCELLDKRTGVSWLGGHQSPSLRRGDSSGWRASRAAWTSPVATLSPRAGAWSRPSTH